MGYSEQFKTYLVEKKYQIEFCYNLYPVKVSDKKENFKTKINRLTRVISCL